MRRIVPVCLREQASHPSLVVVFQSSVGVCRRVSGFGVFRGGRFENGILNDVADGRPESAVRRVDGRVIQRTVLRYQGKLERTKMVGEDKQKVAYF